MVAEASTGGKPNAKRERMRTTLLIVVLLGIVAAGIGVLVLGAFPPAPHTAMVEKTLPLTRPAAPR